MELAMLLEGRLVAKVELSLQRRGRALGCRNGAAELLAAALTPGIPVDWRE